jgi:hypothetical protein
VPQARGQQRDLLQVEGQVRRPRGRIVKKLKLSKRR